jgi:hypothetical protein
MGNGMAYLYKIIRNGNDFSASADGGPSFFVGRRVPYEGNIGLYNIFAGSRLPKLDYNAQDFTAAFGFWAEFVEPTAICEGRNFLTLNSYDRAAFTFGFGQFAAHVEEGDFVQYLRKLLTLPDAVDYFPHLSIKNGHIHALDGLGRSTELENAQTTKPLMSYLNPTLDEVEDAEVIAATRFIHWTVQSQAAREVQISQMVATFKSFMKRAEKRVDMHNRPAAQCCVIADILHHGRGGKMTWPLIVEALRSTRPFEALLKITPPWQGRTEKLGRAIKANPAFVDRTWDSAKQDF